VAEKRTHPGDDEEGDEEGDGIDVQADGFTEFKSRYSKRRCRRVAQQDDQIGQQPSSGLRTRQQVQPTQPGGHVQDNQSTRQVHQHQQRRKNKTAGKSVASTDAIDAAIDSVISQSQSQPFLNQAPTQPQSISAKNFHALTTQVVALQKQVSELKQQVEHLLSLAGTNGPILVDTAINPSIEGSQSYAAAASRQLSAPLREAVLSAVHNDLRVKQSRSCNIVVSGLPIHDEFSDDEFFAELCSLEFGISPDVIRTVRLGAESSDRLRPLLVVLRHEQGAKDLLAMAKQLRQSDDEYTSRCIYISPHQTRAERQVAYEARCRRRQQTNVRQQSPANRTSQRPHGVHDGRSSAVAGSSTAVHSPSVVRRQVVRPSSTNSDHRDRTVALENQGDMNQPSSAAAASVFDVDSMVDDHLVGGEDNGCNGLVTQALSNLRQSAAEFKPSVAVAVRDVAALGSSNVLGTAAVPGK